MMLSIVLVGTGNLAENLLRALFKTKQVKLVQLVGRNPSALKKFEHKVPVTSNYSEILDADVYLLAVSDHAIKSVSKSLGEVKGIIAHTSGATSLNAISARKKGVFYPLQTFTKRRILDFQQIPICLEASDDGSYDVLRKLAESISSKVFHVTSEKRKKLHVAAVFANNFSNHLFHISEMICKEEGLSFELLKPLILETVQKLEILTPQEAQTGPARRNDLESIKEHAALLKDEEHLRIYKLLSKAITKLYEEKL